MSYKTEQENFWSGEFGDEYIERNQGEASIASNTALFSRILNSTNSISSVIEFGANIGLNLEAIKRLLPNAKLSAIEINEKAVNQLNEIENIKVYHSSILDFQHEGEIDFVLIKGVLIHINPNELKNAYELLHKTSRKYICIAEYYNPSPVEVRYRGHEGKLFKRDFAGEIMDQFPDLKLIDYGFVYHKDNNFPQDDTTWFLLEQAIEYTHSKALHLTVM
ncbi:pseudaminic acid biosynthesis-associated methylase [Marinobacter gelidimuriae]|uniref:pseudaminic acid biosynthesis-associated methylase n=1 Tax=Marinobacter gelidimuriae TaxID=2739064 RepID=UPI00036E6B6A|nr:pseudaminic acid biosynthesis-associated methylase [Marinobacter gelidimuriae]